MSSFHYINSASPLSSLIDSQNSFKLKLTKSRLIENYLEEHVPQWRDDSLIQSLFANLPNRDVKPEAFVQKYSFWKDLLVSMTRSRLLSGSVFKFPGKELSGYFKRGGIQPICLNGVIFEMQKEGIVTDSTVDFNFLKQKKSSILGGVANWIFGSLKTVISGSTSDLIDDTDEAEIEALIPAQVLITSLLMEQKELLCDVANNSNFHLPLTFEEFHELVNESRRKGDLVEILEKDDVLLILKFLKFENLLNYSPVIDVLSENVLLAIKIKGTVTSVDLDIVKMKKLHVRLNSQVNELSEKISEVTELARKTLLIFKDRKMATYQLKRRALLEKLQSDRLNSLHAIDEILLRISSVSDEAMILEAYITGTSTLKKLIPKLKDSGEVVDQLQELIADHDEVSQALKQEIGTSSEFDSELEAQLEALISERNVDKDLGEVTDRLEKIKVESEIEAEREEYVVENQHKDQVSRSPEFEFA